MQAAPSAIFAMQLVQDVTILRPLIFMAARDFGFDTLLLVSTRFNARDTLGIWRQELEQICRESGARLEHFESDWDAQRHLTGHGLLFSASETHLPAHITTHNLFRHASPRFLKVTVQHGFECVGFRHSADHVRAHGETASFGADIVCSWASAEQLPALASSQRSKLLVTGPTSVLQTYRDPFERKRGAPCLVCENLHSVRFKGAGDLKNEFVDTFALFSRLMAAKKRKIALRTHPGGQYVLKNRVELPSNVRVENAPMYRLDLRQFVCGISAPSSVLIDMLLADIPAAVWRDPQGDMDADAYAGLATVCSSRDWLEFTQAAEDDPEPFLRLQREFLERQMMPLQPREVFSRFSRLFETARRMEVRTPGSVAARERILFVANDNVPTLQLSWEKPLAPLVARGEIATRLLTEQGLREEFSGEREDRIERYLNVYNPSTIVFCRYSGGGYKPILEWARREQVPVIYHIDDDLLAVPPDIGERKFAVHNAPERLAAVTELLNSADLVYASTEKLKERLRGYFPDLPIIAGKIYCSGSVLREPERGPGCTVGYMASADHAHNLEMVLPAIERLLERNPHVRFETFGSIPVPEKLRRFGNRVGSAPAIANYDKFLNEFAKCEWDVGICPLVPIEFNLMKANTKWVEYTSAGGAVVASRGTVYDECCADGCGIFADGVDEWFSALDLLVNNVDERVTTVERAQSKLEQEFSIASLREQVLDILAEGHRAVRAHDRDDQKVREVSVCQVR